MLLTAARLLYGLFLLWVGSWVFPKSLKLPGKRDFLLETHYFGLRVILGIGLTCLGAICVVGAFIA